MSEDSFPLSTTSECLLKLPVEEAVSESKKHECWDYGEIFFARAKTVEAKADSKAVKAWRLLGHIAQVSLQESEPDEPFRSMLVSHDGRSLVPRDLDSKSAKAVQRLGIEVVDPELRARLLDVTWDCLRQPDAARDAVRNYIASANRLFDPEHWTQYAQRIERAVRLARQLSDKELVGLVLAEIEQRIVELDGEDPLYLTSRLMELLDEFEYGNPDEMSRIAQKAATFAEESNNYERVRSHLKNLSRWRRRANDKDGEKVALAAIAESYVSQSGFHCKQGEEILSAHFLERAHEAYRRIPGMSSRTAEVYRQLRTAQKLALNALQSVSSDGIDVTEIVEQAREHVSGKPLGQALVAFATVTQPTDFDRVTESTRKLMAKYPLQGFFGGVRLGDDGRIIARKTAALTSDKEQENQALWERVVEHVAMSYQLKVQAEIVPAMNQLTFEHSLSLRDLKEIVLDNPIIPPGREELFARALLNGLRWNFPEALSVLVPQLEHSLRHILTEVGAETTRRDKLGLQNVIPLGTILNDAEGHLESIIGQSYLKELKVLFVDQHGPDLRNHIAHGLFSHHHYFSHSAIYAWWFIFFLCINPVSRRLDDRLRASDHNDVDA